jgi:hypothetical protein
MERTAMDKKHSIDNMERAHPVDATLFGSMGAMAASVSEELVIGFIGRRFEFMDVGEIQTIADSEGLSEVNKIYWREILYRVYWASALNIMRHQKWQAACVRAFEAPPNFLAFAASLRGLLEGAQDAWYSLGSVLGTLARDRGYIQSALTGNLRDKGFVARELEDRLIHFIYGRKLFVKTEREMSPASHMALEPKDYRSAIGLPADEREMWKQLYDELCGICHPTAFSLVAYWKDDDGVVEIGQCDDSPQILALCKKYEDTISSALSLSVTTSMVNLKALSWFSLSETKCDEIARWNLEDIPAWKKAQAVVSRTMAN